MRTVEFDGIETCSLCSQRSVLLVSSTAASANTESRVCLPGSVKRPTKNAASFLDRSDQHAFYEVPLDERIDQKDRHGGHHDECVFH